MTPWIAAPAHAESDPIASHPLSASPSAIRDYWTAKRMRVAEPLDGPSAGTAEATASPRAAAPDQEVPAGLEMTYPYRIHGRLFLQLSGEDASCSATVVTSFTRNLILTAGHCVVDPTVGGPSWASNLLFAPGYRNGSSPFGVYPGVTSGGQIQDLLGSRGVAFNRAPKSYPGKVFELLGYPASPPGIYDGEVLVLCSSQFRGIEAFSGALVVSPCHQQEGASGGGWVIPGGIVNSVISHSGCLNPSAACDLISGTYLGTTALKLWAGAAGGLPKSRRRQIKHCKGLKRKRQQRCINRAETFAPVVKP
jgi:hypothetical protein